MTGRQNRMILTGMALRRTAVANPAVTVINAVPAHKVSRPGSGLGQIGKALGREFRAVLGGAE